MLKYAIKNMQNLIAQVYTAINIPRNPAITLRLHEMTRLIQWKNGKLFNVMLSIEYLRTMRQGMFRIAFKRPEINVLLNIGDRMREVKR